MCCRNYYDCCRSHNRPESENKAVDDGPLVAQVFLFAVKRLPVRDRAVVIEFQYPPTPLLGFVAVTHHGLRVAAFVDVRVVTGAELDNVLVGGARTQKSRHEDGADKLWKSRVKQFLFPFGSMCDFR